MSLEWANAVSKVPAVRPSRLKGGHHPYRVLIAPIACRSPLQLPDDNDREQGPQRTMSHRDTRCHPHLSRDIQMRISKIWESFRKGMLCRGTLLRQAAMQAQLNEDRARKWKCRAVQTLNYSARSVSTCNLICRRMVATRSHSSDDPAKAIALPLLCT